MGWVESVPVDVQILSYEWLNRLVADLENIFAAIDWALDRDNAEAAARLVSASGGAFANGIAPMLAVRWTMLLAEKELDTLVRARLLLSGSLGAVTAGTHEHIGAWAIESADLAHDRDPLVESIALTWQATPLMTRSPERVPALLSEARAIATTAASSLCLGFVDGWSVHADFCAGKPVGGRVDPSHPEVFGGAHSSGWSVAVQLGILTEPLAGRLDVGIALAEAMSPLTPNREIFDICRVLAVTIAGDTAVARLRAHDYVRVVDRLGDSMMRGELALAIAIVRLRDGDTATALSYLEAVKKAPMYGPHLFRLRLDYAVKARAALADQSAIDAAIEQGRALTIENILDRELRSPV